MTWGELKSNLINLGFESDKAYGENPKLFIQAVNRAMSLIGWHSAIYAKKDDGYNYFGKRRNYGRG